MFNEELGNPFIIIHSISLLKAEEHSVAILLLRIEKEELDMKGSGFYVSLEWVIVSKKKEGKQDSEPLAYLHCWAPNAVFTACFSSSVISYTT